MMMLISALLISSAACGGEDTKTAACNVQEQEDGSIRFQCGDDAPVILQGPQGPAGEQGKAGMNGMNGENGKDGLSVLSRTESATQEKCPYGGTLVSLGPDENENGELDKGEETRSFVVCQGVPGDGNISRVQVSPASMMQCPSGGKSVDVGVDSDQSGSLEQAEITDTFAVCNGTTGANGRTSLIEVNVGTAPGCPAGGNTLTVGVDQDANGSLSNSEKDTSFEVCHGQNGMNGMDGMDGQNGMNGQNGADGMNGQNGQNGMDGSSCSVVDNGNGTRTLSCTDGTSVTIQDGTDGMNGQNGADGMNGQNGADGMNGQDGMNGSSCTVVDNGNGTKTLSCTDGTSVIIRDGMTQGGGNGGDPHAVAPPKIASMVTAGLYHTCVMLSTGAIECWGENDFGEVGSGIEDQSTYTPVRVQGLLRQATKVSAQGAFTCAMLDDQSVWCWGGNTSRQIGDGTSTHRQLPVQVAGLPADVVDMETGGSHACILTMQGTVWCWGDHGMDLDNDGNHDISSTPTLMPGLSNVVELAPGGAHSCVRHTGGTVSCWGRNTSGQLGDGTLVSKRTPVPVPGLTNVIELVSGTFFTCARFAAGNLKCWGSNTSGQLGDGTLTTSSSPVDVMGITNAIQIDGGGAHTCAVLQTGALNCWGAGTWGQLGDGNAASTNTPIIVPGITDAAHVSAGNRHTCVATQTGVLYCWGSTLDGRLGHPNFGRTPGRVVGF